MESTQTRHYGAVPGALAGVFAVAFARFREAALIAAIVVAPSAARAQFEGWLSPGELSKAHAGLKGVSNCTQCHATARGVPDAKCLACHAEIKERIEKKKGYHARLEQQCNVCHVEHKGAAHDLMGLSRVPFTHDDTGWPLTGAHQKLECADCHKQKRVDPNTKKSTGRPTYLGNSPRCLSCHEDVHRAKGTSFQDCTKCHTTEQWNRTKAKPRFNHDRETDFALVGRHRDVGCLSCHKTKAWAPLAHERCSNCHVDPHQGSLGPKCQDCHNNMTWRITGQAPGKGAGGSTGGGAFDHQKTRFPLTGAHAKVDCKTCHGPRIGKMSNFEQCNGCHNNPHGDQFQRFWSVKKSCTNCHVTESWKALSFNHNKDSRYRIEDRHQSVPCQQCHASGGPASSSSRRWRWLNAPADCATCHNDVHKGQFVGKPCAACHSTKGFEALLFNHNKDSRFSLVGKHNQIECESCHENGKFKGQPTSCDGCHNDFHQGELGNECARCHTPTTFRAVEFDHNRESRFPLTGAHAKNQCNQCHVEYKYKIRATDCASCHVDVHKGAFGNECSHCHNTTNFKSKGGFHNFGEYRLTGIHDRVPCATCHNPKAPVRPEPTQCSSCHSDPHMNSLGQRCYTCHNQINWLPTQFRHQQTGFDLQGAHRFLSCDRCHFNRVFGGTPSECIVCHISSFKPQATFPPHPPAPADCSVCHYPFGWRPTRS